MQPWPPPISCGHSTCQPSKNTHLQQKVFYICIVNQIIVGWCSPQGSSSASRCTSFMITRACFWLTLTLLDLTKSYKKLSPKHAARGIVQSPYPTYRHGKACLSKQPPWRAAGDPRLARGRSRVRAPGPAGALRALFFSTLPSFLLREIFFFFAPSPPNLWNLWLG